MNTFVDVKWIEARVVLRIGWLQAFSKSLLTNNKRFNPNNFACHPRKEQIHLRYFINLILRRKFIYWRRARILNGIYAKAIFNSLWCSSMRHSLSFGLYQKIGSDARWCIYSEWLLFRGDGLWVRRDMREILAMCRQWLKGIRFDTMSHATRRSGRLAWMAFTDFSSLENQTRLTPLLKQKEETINLIVSL